MWQTPRIGSALSDPCAWSIDTTRQAETLGHVSCECIVPVEEDGWRSSEAQPFRFLWRLNQLESDSEFVEAGLGQRFVQALIGRAPIRTPVEVSEGYSGLSNCCFFHASSPGLWWKRGKTQRNMLRPGFRHQQSG